MNESFAALALLFCTVFFTPQLHAQISRTRTRTQPSTPEAVIANAGGILSHDDHGHVTGLQFPENLTMPAHAWAALEQLTDLRELDLSAMLLTNDRLRHVSKLKNLRSLNLAALSPSSQTHRRTK